MRSALPVSIQRLRQIIEERCQREIENSGDDIGRKSCSAVKEKNECAHEDREQVIDSNKSAPITRCDLQVDVCHIPTSSQHYNGLRYRRIRTAPARHSAVKISPVHRPELSRKCPGVMCVMGLIGQSLTGATAASSPESRNPNI